MYEPKFINAEQFVDKYGDWYTEEGTETGFIGTIKYLVEKMPAADIPRWIPVTERLPETTDPVNITWVNRKPSRYNEHIKDKPFVATGHYCNGRWYWFSAVCQDYLNEYGDCEMDRIDSAIEVIAWMPLPTPYKGGEEE